MYDSTPYVLIEMFLSLQLPSCPEREEGVWMPAAVRSAVSQFGPNPEMDMYHF